MWVSDLKITADLTEKRKNRQLLGLEYKAKNVKCYHHLKIMWKNKQGSGMKEKQSLWKTPKQINKHQKNFTNTTESYKCMGLYPCVIWFPKCYWKLWSSFPIHKVLLKTRKRGFPAGSVVKNPCSHGILSLQACGCCCRLVAKSWPTLLQPHGLVARQASLSMGFPRQAQEWVAISFSRGSFQPKDQTHLSCSGRCVLHRWAM